MFRKAVLPTTVYTDIDFIKQQEKESNSKPKQKEINFKHRDKETNSMLELAKMYKG